MTNGAAYLLSQVAACQCERVAMQTENWQRQEQGLALAYGPEDFFALPEKFGLNAEAAKAALGE